jgi:transcriptional regulator with XRE-family HTH domain
MDLQGTPSVGSIIRKRRRELDSTLQHVASKCGISTAYLSQIERGERFPQKPTVFSRIANTLAIDESVLITIQRNTAALRDDAPRLLEALRDLHDFARPLGGRSYVEQSNKAFFDAAELLRKHGG